MQGHLYLAIFQLTDHYTDKSKWTEADERIIQQHFNFHQSLFDKGIVIQVGKTDYDVDNPENKGIVILQAEGREQAEKYIHEDPAVIHGIMKVKVHPYQIYMDGVKRTADSLLKLFERDLNKLMEEVNLYPEESKLWEIKNEIQNSAGNLCLHIVGNLNHFIGATLGHTGYVRDRPAEFASRIIPRSTLIAMIEETKSTVLSTLSVLSDSFLQQDYPLEVFGGNVNTEYFLTHLSTHLSYHLGQVNYHRRLI